MRQFRRTREQEFNSYILALEDDGHNWTTAHEGSKSGEERLVLEVSIVLLHMVLGGMYHLQGDNLVSSTFKSAIEDDKSQ